MKSIIFLLAAISISFPSLAGEVCRIVYTQNKHTAKRAIKTQCTDKAMNDEKVFKWEPEAHWQLEKLKAIKKLVDAGYKQEINVFIKY